MLDSNQFTILSQHLIDISDTIPFQPITQYYKEFDRKMPNLHEYENYNDLNAALAHKVKQGLIANSDVQCNYYRYLWFVNQCNRCDHFLFSLTSPADKYRLQVKDIVGSKDYHDNPSYMDTKPLLLIDRFFKQERGNYYRPKGLQNTLFLSFYSYAHPKNATKLLTMFEMKHDIFQNYDHLISSPAHRLFQYMNDRVVDVIYIIERNEGIIEYSFGSEQINGGTKIKKIITM